MFKWLRQRKLKKRCELVHDIANATYDLLSSSNSWEKFLPPVVIDNSMYMLTENGSIYRLSRDFAKEMEVVTQIRVR